MGFIYEKIPFEVTENADWLEILECNPNTGMVRVKVCDLPEDEISGSTLLNFTQNGTGNPFVITFIREAECENFSYSGSMKDETVVPEYYETTSGRLVVSKYCKDNGRKIGEELSTVTFYIGSNSSLSSEIIHGLNRYIPSPVDAVLTIDGIKQASNQVRTETGIFVDFDGYQDAAWNEMKFIDPGIESQTLTVNSRIANNRRTYDVLIEDAPSGIAQSKEINVTSEILSAITDVASYEESGDTYVENQFSMTTLIGSGVRITSWNDNSGDTAVEDYISTHPDDIYDQVSWNAPFYYRPPVLRHSITISMANYFEFPDDVEIGVKISARYFFTEDGTSGNIANLYVGEYGELESVGSEYTVTNRQPTVTLYVFENEFGLATRPTGDTVGIYHDTTPHNWEKAEHGDKNFKVTELKTFAWDGKHPSENQKNGNSYKLRDRTTDNSTNWSFKFTLVVDEP
jgi:hypothetical protein